MRCSEPGHRVQVAIERPRGPGRYWVVRRRMAHPVRALLLFVLVLSCGCKRLPTAYTARQQFEHEHPQAVVLSTTKYEVLETGSPPRAEFVFRLRDQNGSQREEVWRY